MGSNSFTHSGTFSTIFHSSKLEEVMVNVCTSGIFSALTLNVFSQSATYQNISGLPAFVNVSTKLFTITQFELIALKITPPQINKD